MSIWTVGKYPLMYAGRLPADATTLKYVTNPTAMAINSDSKNNRVVGYDGNCTCRGGISSCTLGKPQVGPSCVVTWAAETELEAAAAGAAAGAGGLTTSTVAVVINMGDSNATVVTSFRSLGLPSASTNLYDVSELWSGTAMKGLKGNEGIKTVLRMHASVLYTIVPARD